ncbi:MAG TPA: metal ABC transporter permease [Streptosporangiaceae bacterium]|nr:metal ABC transporter permease [Streptosporangiaceae bacterium]
MTAPVVTATVASTPSGLTLNIVSDVRQLFLYPFMVNAFRAGTIVAVTAGALGWFMVLRRQSFAGHTLAVVSFPGAAAAILAGVSAIGGYFTASIAAAIVIAAIPRSLGGRAGSSESAVIGTVQAFALACGALFVSLYGGFLTGLTNLLFGSFLGISRGQVLTLLLVAIIALAGLAAIGRPLFFATVDPDVAVARGVPAGLVSAIFLILLGCAAAEVSQITGALLVFALLVMPAATAQRLTARPLLSFCLTIAFGLIIVWLGLAIAYFSVYPVGFYITTFGFAGYVLAAAARRAAGYLARPRTVPA